MILLSHLIPVPSRDGYFSLINCLGRLVEVVSSRLKWEILFQNIMWKVIKEDLQCQCLASTYTGICMATHTHDPLPCKHAYTHVHIQYMHANAQKWDLFFSSFWARIGSHVGAVEGVGEQPVEWKLNESESYSVLELAFPLPHSRLAWKATLPGGRNWHPIEIDGIFKHFSISVLNTGIWEKFI